MGSLPLALSKERPKEFPPQQVKGEKQTKANSRQRVSHLTIGWMKLAMEEGCLGCSVSMYHRMYFLPGQKS